MPIRHSHRHVECVVEHMNLEPAGGLGAGCTQIEWDHEGKKEVWTPSPGLGGLQEEEDPVTGTEEETMKNEWEWTCTVGGNVNWCSHYGKQYGVSSKH